MANQCILKEKNSLVSTFRFFLFFYFQLNLEIKSTANLQNCILVFILDNITAYLETLL